MIYKYRRSLVTLIDILGFKKIVETKDANSIGKILSDIKEISAGDAENGIIAPGLAGSIAFSDTIVRVCPVDTSDSTGAFFYELNSLNYILTTAVGNGVFLRGGITIGEVYFNLDTEIIFGPAMNRAYEIESKLAIYPRIIIDPLLIKAYAAEPVLRGQAHSLEMDQEYTSKFLRTSEDELQFVDYLTAAKDDLEEMKMNYREFLIDHRQRIIAAVKTTDKIISARQKFFWLANYHNKVVQEQFDEDEQDGVLIEMSELES
jgi:hypothetical protein